MHRWVGWMAGCMASSSVFHRYLRCQFDSQRRQPSWFVVRCGLGGPVGHACELGHQVFVALLRPGLGTGPFLVSFSCRFANVQRLEQVCERVSLYRGGIPKSQSSYSPAELSGAIDPIMDRHGANRSTIRNLCSGAAVVLFVRLWTGLHWS